MKTLTYIGDIETGTLVDAATNVQYAIARGETLEVPDRLAEELLAEPTPRFAVADTGETKQ